MASSLTCSGLAPTSARTAATSLPSSRSRAHASRAIPPVALGIEQNSSGIPRRMSGQDSSVQSRRFVLLQIPTTDLSLANAAAERDEYRGSDGRAKAEHCQRAAAETARPLAIKSPPGHGLHHLRTLSNAS